MQDNISIYFEKQETYWLTQLFVRVIMFQCYTHIKYAEVS